MHKFDKQFSLSTVLFMSFHTALSEKKKKKDEKRHISIPFDFQKISWVCQL